MIDQLTAENFEIDYPLFIEHYKSRFGGSRNDIEEMYEMMIRTPGTFLDMVEEILRH